MPANKWTNYTSVRNNFSQRINAYRTLLGQTSGGTPKFRPTPAQLKTFAKWVEKGATLHYVTNAQLNRWAGTSRNWTLSTAKNTLTTRYGRSSIKAVAYNKSGGFLVATSSTYRGRSFRFW